MTVEARNPEQWRKWLARHHQAEAEVWLVFYKQHTGRESIAYGDALDEALCHGWVDSLIKRLDDDRYARKFTPRKPESKWSEINRKRYAELKAAGRMQPAGLDRPPTGRGYAKPPAAPAAVPDYFERALDKNRAAKQYFETLAPSHRRAYLRWVDSAKREETKLKRLKEALELLASKKQLGLK